METLKALVQSKFKTLSFLAMALAFSFILLMVRVKLNRSFFYLFLVWNVFLAIIPYSITLYLNTRQNITKLKLGFWFLLWLAFLPNAPYIVTDLIHIRSGNNLYLWLDILVVLSFALSGLLIFYYSIMDMQQIIVSRFNRIPVKTATLLILFLCGFGVYIGRFLRYNSWGIISQPDHLLSDIIAIISSPFQNFEAWLFTISFGGFLVVGYMITKTILYNKS